ncbi:MAG TPA: hypothetical protein VG322_05445 [Candidatus Acidoferrales bacterium]|nr:hypothetical protein [Candidatus Acidoferrales bacterium]
MKIYKALTARQRRLLGTGAQALAAGIAIGIVIYAGIEIGSCYLKTHDFEEAVKKEARLAASDSRPAENIREELLEKSEELGLPVSRETITVTSGSKRAQIPIEGITALAANANQSDMPTVGAINIDVSYEVPISFLLYTLQLRFHLHADEHSL